MNFKRLLAAALLVLVLPVSVGFAHGGGTDSDGGHYDRSTGEYHYHHGYSAHQHPGGECPYQKKSNPTPTARPTVQSISVTAAPTSTRRSGVVYSSHIPGIFRTTANVNLRKGPSTSEAVIVTVPADTEIDFTGNTAITDDYKKWYEVEYLGMNGWLYSEYAVRVEPTATVFNTPAAAPSEAPIPHATSSTDWWPYLFCLLFGLVPFLWSIISHRRTIKLLNRRYESDQSFAVFRAKAEIRNEINAQWQQKHDLEMANMEERIRRIEAQWGNRLADEKRKLLQTYETHENALLQQISSYEDTSAELREELEHYKLNEQRFSQNQNLRDYLATHPDAPDLSRGVVYMERSANSAFYHHLKHCTDADVILVSRIYADLIMLKPCPLCADAPQPSADIPVEVAPYSSGPRSLYHAEGKHCIQSGVLKPLSKARADGYAPCPKCRPPQELPTIWF